MDASTEVVRVAQGRHGLKVSKGDIELVRQFLVTLYNIQSSTFLWQSSAIHTTSYSTMPSSLSKRQSIARLLHQTDNMHNELVRFNAHLDDDRLIRHRIVLGRKKYAAQYRILLNLLLLVQSCGVSAIGLGISLSLIHI